MVDTISSLGSIDYQHDNWDVDVTVAGSQKGLMLPPGIAFNFISRKALEHSKLNSYNRSYWDWGEIAKNSDSVSIKGTSLIMLKLTKGISSCIGMPRSILSWTINTN
mgnify:CR=1 FL=1